MWLGDSPLKQHRQALARCLSAAGIAEAAIPDIEQAVDVFRVLLASPGPTRESAELLCRLAKASEQFMDALAALDDDGRDLLLEMAVGLGTSAAFLRELADGHRQLAGPLTLADRARGERFAKGGRPVEGARGGLMRALQEILIRHRRPSRRKVLEAARRQGLSVSARAENPAVARRCEDHRISRLKSVSGSCLRR